MRGHSFKFMLLIVGGLMLFSASSVFAQDTPITEKALRNALVEICYGTKVMVDLNDPKKTEVSLEEVELSDKEIQSIIADAAETDGSYEALSDVLINHCLGEETNTKIREAQLDPQVINVILVDAGVQNVETFFLTVNEYVIFEQQIITYFESYSFTEEQYSAVFFALEFGTSTEVTDLLVSYGVDAEAAAGFTTFAENAIDGIEAEDPADIDGDGTLNIEDEDDDGDGIVDAEDTDENGDGIEDVDQDDDTDNDGIDDVEDADDDNDGVEDVADDDADGDGVNDDDADGDGIEDAQDEDDDGDGVADAEDTDDDGDGQEDQADDSMMGGDEDNGGAEEDNSGNEESAWVIFPSNAV